MTARSGAVGRAVRRGAAAALLGLGLAGCSLVPGFLGGRSISSLSLRSEDGAERDMAVAVDLVMTTSDAASAAVATLGARDWFQRRTQLLRDFPEDIKIASWELAPGQAIEDAPIDSPGGLQDAFVFALYATPGDHRLHLTAASRVRVTLGETDLRLGL